MAELNAKTKEQLAHLYDLEEYKALRVMIEAERFNIATKLLLLPAQESTNIAHMQGQAYALKRLHQEIKKIHKDLVKD